MTAPTSTFDAVWRAVRAIPHGSVRSYADVAEEVLGSRRAARTVGWALSGCPRDVPWWRIIRSDGSLPGVADELQARLLRGEGWRPGRGAGRAGVRAPRRRRGGGRAR